MRVGHIGAGVGALFMGLAGGCSLFTSLDGLSTGFGPDGGTRDAGDASSDAAVGDSGAGDAAVGDGGSSDPCDGGGDPDLVGYYPFEESSGSRVRDCSGHGNDGTVISEPDGGPWGPGHVGGGFYGDGAGGCIDFGVPPDLLLESTPFTIAMWVSAHVYDDGTLARYLFGRTKVAANGGYRLGTGNGDDLLWTIHSGGSSTDTSSPGGLAHDVWMHVALTYSPSDNLATIYLNGVGVATGNAPAITADDTANVRVGCRGDGINVLEGIIDDVRVYRRALTLVEIQALAQ